MSLIDRLRQLAKDAYQLADDLERSILGKPGEPMSHDNALDVSGPRAWYEQAATGSGINPAVALAIWSWETGHGTSKLWREAYNPGGIKDSNLFNAGTYTAADGTVYERFSAPLEGITAHIHLLKRSRYSAAWNKPAAEQVKAIAAAGYIGRSDVGDAGVLEWINGVTKLALELEEGHS